MNCSWEAAPIPPPPSARRPEGHPVNAHSVQRTGEGAQSRELLEARGSGHFGQLLTSPGGSPEPQEPRTGPATLPGRAWACRECRRAPGVCMAVCVAARPTRCLAVMLAPKARSSGVPAPNVPVGCTPAWVTGLCPAQPALCPPRELGHHGACPPPGPVFGTESPHCPAPPPPAGPGQHRGPGRKRVSPSPRGGRGPSSWGGAWLRWNNDSFLEAKDTTTGMEGR